MTFDLKEHLKALKKEPVFFQPDHGDAGDTLIGAATFQLFDDLNLNHRIVSEEDDLAGKLVIYAGGGNFTEHSHFAAKFIRKHHAHVKRLIMLPQTITGHEELLGELGGNVDLIAREPTTYAYLEEAAPGANVYLSEDMAFMLDLNRLYSARPLKRFPIHASIRIKRHYAKFSGHLYCMRTDGERTGRKIPWHNVDLSAIFGKTEMSDRKGIETVAVRFLQFQKPFRKITTNRLHVAIAGGMLDKKVNMYSNSYLKNQSVYEYSIKDRFPKVIWKEDTDQS